MPCRRDPDRQDAGSFVVGRVRLMGLLVVEADVDGPAEVHDGVCGCA